jgi:glucosamine 6-phosphate synthetase-like amidotransferase/phosphosugar isomerase protein
MEKEIHEQAEVVSHTLSNYIDFAEGKVRLDTGQLDFANLEPVGDVGLRHSLLCRPDRKILV